MMRNDNIDLLSKLRQRLFLTNMWTQQKMPKMPFNTVNNGNEKHLLEQFIENNNQLDVGTLSRNSNERRSVDEEGMEESEGRRSGEEIGKFSFINRLLILMLRVFLNTFYILSFLTHKLILTNFSHSTISNTNRKHSIKN